MGAAEPWLNSISEINPHLRGPIRGEYMKTCVLSAQAFGWDPGATTQLHPILLSTARSLTGAASD